MNSFAAYREYLALKNHFTKPNYDYFMYGGNINAKEETFNNRPDKVFFQKLAKHEDVTNFLVANFIVNPKLWIKSLAYAAEPEKVYKEWMKRKLSLSHVFKEDLDKLDEIFDNNFKIIDGQHPILLKKFLGNEISIETLCILLAMTGAEKYWSKNLLYDMIWDDTKLKIVKYTPFIEYDKEKFKKIVLDKFNQV